MPCKKFMDQRLFSLLDAEIETVESRRSQPIINPINPDIGFKSSFPVVGNPGRFRHYVIGIDSSTAKDITAIIARKPKNTDANHY